MATEYNVGADPLSFPLYSWSFHAVTAGKTGAPLEMFVGTAFESRARMRELSAELDVTIVRRLHP